MRGYGGECCSLSITHGRDRNLEFIESVPPEISFDTRERTSNGSRPLYGTGVLQPNVVGSMKSGNIATYLKKFEAIR